jgi:hypothetical protein
LLCQHFPLAGVSIAFVDAPLMLYALDASLSGIVSPVRAELKVCHKDDAYRMLREWLCGPRGHGVLVLPDKQIALTPGALDTHEFGAAELHASSDRDAWLAEQLRTAASRERAGRAQASGSTGHSLRQSHPEQALASSALVPAAMRRPDAPLASAIVEAQGWHSERVYDPEPVARTMFPGHIEQRASQQRTLAANAGPKPSAAADSGELWIDRQIALAARREQAQREAQELAVSARLSSGGLTSAQSLPTDGARTRALGLPMPLARGLSASTA